MTTLSTKRPDAADSVAELTAARAVPLVMAALLGMFIIGGVGFSHIEAVHNASHDYRHSIFLVLRRGTMTFPTSFSRRHRW
jgi:cobalt transporter subunit CbtB